MKLKYPIKSIKEIDQANLSKESQTQASLNISIHKKSNYKFLRNNYRIVKIFFQIQREAKI